MNRKINCAGTVEGATAIVQAADRSASIGCHLTFVQQASKFTAFVGTTRSSSDARPATFAGRFKGEAYLLDLGSLLALQSGGIPGSTLGSVHRGSMAY